MHAPPPTARVSSIRYGVIPVKPPAIVVNPRTLTGTERSRFNPSPISPKAPAPQQRRVLFAKRAQV